MIFGDSDFFETTMIWVGLSMHIRVIYVHTENAAKLGVKFVVVNNNKENQPYCLSLLHASRSEQNPYFLFHISRQ